MLRIVCALSYAARRVHDDFVGRKGKPGPKDNTSVATFARGLAPIYKAVTGKEAKANFSKTREGRLGKRGSPFVQFVACCLEPIDPGKVNSSLGDIVRAALPRLKDNKRQTKG